LTLPKIGGGSPPLKSAPVPSGRETTSIMFLNYTLVSSCNHIQNPVCARTSDFTMAAAGRAFGPTRAAPGIRKPKLRALARKAELIESDVEMSRCVRWCCAARLWHHYYKFHIIEQCIQFVYYLPFDFAVH